MKSIVGSKERLSARSTKYGYSIKGLAVKTAKGYRSTDGELVETAVSNDASNIVKVATFAKDVKKGDIIIYQTFPLKVLEMNEVKDGVSIVTAIDLTTGEVKSQLMDTGENLISVLWDTFKHPEKGMDEVNKISFNEFTPAQLYELGKGSITVEELRNPPTVDSLESIITSLIAKVTSKPTSHFNNQAADTIEE